LATPHPQRKPSEEIPFSGKNDPSWTKVGHEVGHVRHGFLSVPEVAARIGKAPKTITRWCETGQLPAMAKPFGKKITYLIHPADLEAFLLAQEQTAKPAQEVKTKAVSLVDLIPAWVAAMAGGGLNGRAYSALTIPDYEQHVRTFLKEHKAVSVQALRRNLLSLPVEQFCKREKRYKAVICFAKFLILEAVLDSGFLEEAKSLAPKRHIPPKRLTVDDAGLSRLLDVCQSEQDRAIVWMLAGTGLRASELCGLLWVDIDLEKAALTVQKGKGNKRRRVGLPVAVVDALRALMASQGVTTEAVFLDRDGEPLTRHGLGKRLQRMGQHAGVKVHPHALRRAFVTLNANKGRSLVMLQMACGHSDIKTTRSYCQTAEQEVIDAMKGW
jgi:integrase